MLQLEWNIVVEILALWRLRLPSALLPSALLPSALGRLCTRSRAAILPVVRRSAAFAVEHLHFIGDDLGGVAIIAALVLPLAGLQLAFDVDL